MEIEDKNALAQEEKERMASQKELYVLLDRTEVSKYFKCILTNEVVKNPIAIYSTGKKRVTFALELCDTKNTHRYDCKQNMNEKPYKCDLCEKRLSTEPHLKRHMFIHSGKKPFNCEECKMCFSDTYRLKMHMLKHTQERPFKCHTCSAGFKDKKA